LFDLGYRVSKLDNAIITQFFVEALNKLEIAAGFRGTLLFGILAIALGIYTRAPESAGVIESGPILPRVTAVAIALVVMEGSRAMASYDLKKVNDLIAEIESGTK